MVNNAFDKMLFGTDWGKLDVLVIDMPPGAPCHLDLPVRLGGGDGVNRGRVG